MTAPLRIGSLFSGYGGLEMGLQSVVGGEVAFHAEFDDAPSRVLAHHWPDIPNLGDVRLIDWADVEHVDWLVGGFPCQDVSLAGLRRGLKEGTRSGLWSEFARAIDQLRPSYVLIENVRGLLSAEADRNMESDPWGLGEPDGGRGPVLRALGAVLGDLADLGYDAEWCGVRAADSGAPHGRFRVFIVAYPADPASGGRDGRTPHPIRRTVERTAPAGDCGVAATHTGGARLREHTGEPSQQETGPRSRDESASPDRRRTDANRRANAPHTNDLGINGGGATR